MNTLLQIRYKRMSNLRLARGLVLLTWWFIVRNVVQNSLVPIIRQFHLVTTIETG